MLLRILSESAFHSLMEANPGAAAPLLGDLQMTFKEIRALFWQTYPDLPRRRYRYSWNRSDKSAELVYPIDTRCAFVDFIDALHRDGRINENTANKITL